MPETRKLYPGLVDTLSVALADHANGRRTDASMVALDPNWQAKATAVGAPVLGPNVIVNGEFNSNVDSWGDQSGAVADPVHGVSGGREYLYMNVVQTIAIDGQIGVGQTFAIAGGDIGKTVKASCDFFMQGGSGPSARSFAIVYAVPSYVELVSLQPGHVSAAAGWLSVAAEGSVPIPAGSTNVQMFLLTVADTGVAIAPGAIFPSFDNAVVRLLARP